MLARCNLMLVPAPPPPAVTSPLTQWWQWIVKQLWQWWQGITKQLWQWWW